MGPNYGYVVQGSPPGSTVKLVTDGAEVRTLMGEQERRAPSEDSLAEEALQRGGYPTGVDMRLHPEKYNPGRVQFIDSMKHLPAVAVPAGSYARFLEQSKAKCEVVSYYNAMYVKVRITTGPKRGVEGWACFGEVSPTFP